MLYVHSEISTVILRGNSILAASVVNGWFTAVNRGLTKYDVYWKSIEFPGRFLTHSAGGGGEIIARKREKKDSGLMNRVCCATLMVYLCRRLGPGLVYQH